MDAALERMLNLLLESERAGMAVLDSLAAEVKHPELKELLLDAREDESHNVGALERLVREGGGTPSAATGRSRPRSRRSAICADGSRC